ncbi:glutamate-rich WD repeat-containing protein 1, partial [Caerostris extrusa]
MANEEIDDEYDEIDDGDMEVAENDVNNEENMNSSDSEIENVDSPHVNYDNNSINLDYDETAYDCLYTLRTGYPLLSFDIIKDNLGDNRANQYPLTMTVVGGTEVKKIRKNHLMVIKMSNILKDKPHSDSDDSLLSEDDEEKEDEKPKLDIAHVPHKGCVNRVK